MVKAGTEQGVPRLWVGFQLQQSDFPLRSEFPVFIQNSVDWLQKQQGGSLGRALAGEKKEFPIHLEAERAVWLPVEPAGAEIMAEYTGDTISAVQAAPPLPGLYRWVEKDRAGKELQSRFLEVTMDSRESNLNAKADLVIDIDAAAVNETKQQLVDSDRSEFSLIPWVLALLLLLMLLEWEVYRRGHSI
ncbi:hypothetical protein D3C73_854020 [compost metagenome]